VATLARAQPVDATALRQSLTEVADFRQVPLRPLSPLLTGYEAIAQSRWTAWRRRQHLVDQTPDDFGAVLTEVVAFADPVLSGTVSTGGWDHAAGSWR
jgi:hypothetical protein